MRRVDGDQVANHLAYFKAAAVTAAKARCHRVKCGTVIVKEGIILGEGYNGPALDDESRRMCDAGLTLARKPKYDKTCCIHAEWRAIMQACKHHGDEVAGSVLYFMRVDDTGAFTDAGQPYCTTCSRLTMEAGVKEFALWNDGGADIYSAAEYDAVSYAFYADNVSV